MKRLTFLRRAVAVAALGFAPCGWLVADVQPIAATLNGFGSLPVLGSRLGPIQYQPVIVAGDPAGTPTDSPALRVDPNTTTSIYSGVGSLFLEDLPIDGSGFICTGTPITSLHILTAAHCVDGATANGVVDVVVGSSLFILNRGGPASSVLSISAITMHPDYTGFANPTVNDDLAIVTLTAPLPAGTPIYPIWGFPVGPATPFNAVGYGRSGDAVAGYTVAPSFTVKRWGANSPDAADLDDEAPNTAFEVFYMDFDGPTGVGFMGAGTYGNNVETTFGGGDSGGPSFIYYAGQLYQAGVNTFTFDYDAVTPLFGSGAGGILLEPYFGWISATAPGVLIVVPEPSTVMAGVALGGLTLGTFVRSRLRRRQSKPSGN